MSAAKQATTAALSASPMRRSTKKNTAGQAADTAASGRMYVRSVGEGDVRKCTKIRQKIFTPQLWQNYLRRHRNGQAPLP